MWSFLLIAGLGGLAASAHGPAVDNEMVKALEESIDSDLLIITIKQLKPRKIFREDAETLFALQGMRDTTFAVKLDRYNKKVIIESRNERKHINVDSVDEHKVISNLVLLFDQSKNFLEVILFIDCNKEGKITISETLKEMFHSVNNPLEKVYRERKYVTDLDSDTEIQEVLKRLKCSVNEQMLSTQPQPADEIPIESRTAEVHIRGDIPLITDCDDNYLFKAIRQLIEIINRLQEELEAQRIETRNLRRLLEQCDICRPGAYGGSQDSHVIAPINCRTRPCFPGVECRDTNEGPRCARCPPGYVGDGRSCKPGVTCDQNPCFHGVRCFDTVEGFQCGPCPPGYSGNGQRCKPKYGCDTSPCSPGVQCQNIYEPPFYRCGICPTGFTGNGTNCHDIDECDLAEPCDSRVHCTNLSPGYRCGPCPAGFTGSAGLEGVGLEVAVRNKQKCFDIDECADGRNGGCVPNSVCHNTEGSFQCGNCKNGFVGNQTVGCHSSPGLCPDGTRCDQNADCIRTAYDRYTCKCKVGWAGDGRVCASDRDLDGWPDYDLRCSDTRCRKNAHEQD